MTKNKEFFKATVCRTCGFCKEPRPGFCTTLYNTDGPRFISEIVERMCTLRTSGFDMTAFTEFEGFVILFCKADRCPLYDNNCRNLISTQVACYQSFLVQAGIRRGFGELTSIYSKWSGIELRKIGSKFGSLDNISTKQGRKKLKKTLKKLRKAARKAHGHTNVKKVGKKITTGLFYNSSSEWKEKILTYLGENEQPKNNNRQQNKAHKCAGESD